jgi:hypothetical protein
MQACLELVLADAPLVSARAEKKEDDQDGHDEEAEGDDLYCYVSIHQ